MMDSESKKGKCEKCGKDDIEVFASGYFVGFLCLDCYDAIHNV